VITLIAALASVALQATPAVAFPANPQGRQVEAFVKALHTGEAAFVTFQADHMLLARTFAFSFEKAAPYRIIDMNVQVTQ